MNADRFNKDLQNISDWAYQWKMSFNTDFFKQTQEVIFSRKSHKFSHSPVFLNNSPVVSASIVRKM